MEERQQAKYKLDLKKQLPELSASYKKISCTACGSEVPSANININDKIAKCDNCNVVFSYEAEVSDLLQKSKVKQEIVRPEGIDLFSYRDEIEFTIRQPWTAIEIITVMLFPFFALLLSFIQFKKGVIPDWVLLSTWVGAIGAIINAYLRPKHKVYITVDDQYLSVQWRPKKFQKDQQYPIGQIDQLYTRMVEHQYGVFIIINGPDGQRHQKLISGLTSGSKARYLEQEIERHLGIEDREVPEEL